MNETAHFEQLLKAAAAGPEVHRLLFVFAAAQAPDRPTPAQTAQFEAGEGGTLAPLMCVDKAPQEISGFDALLAESREAGPPWQVMFAAALPGRAGAPPSSEEVEQALKMMVDSIHAGNIGRFAAFGPDGEPLLFR